MIISFKQSEITNADDLVDAINLIAKGSCPVEIFFEMNDSTNAPSEPRITLRPRPELQQVALRNYEGTGH